jgi:dTDP-4-amino-4,6-dideoxygalactose transaminase
MRIPFNVPFVHGREVEYIREAIANRHFAGNGPFTAKCHSWLQNRMQVDKVLLTHSCTAALEMAAILSGVGPGDEVIMPSFTFVSTANAFVLRGATPVFVDIRDDTCNLDEALVENAITPRTKAIVVVHYAGVACSMDPILEIARRHGLLVIEDAAQGILSSYRGVAGGLGHLAAVSFHETKNDRGPGRSADRQRCAMGPASRRSSGKRGPTVLQFFQGTVDKYLGGHRVVVHAERNQCGVSVRAARSRQHDYRTAARRVADVP